MGTLLDNNEEEWWKEYAGKRVYVAVENSKTGEERRFYGTVLDRPGRNLDEVWVEWDEIPPGAHVPINEQLMWLAYLHFEEGEESLKPTDE